MVKRLFSVSKLALPHSTVIPYNKINEKVKARVLSNYTTTVCTLARSSLPVSRAQERYQDSRPSSFDSFSYFSKVLLSTIPVRKRMWPPMVDLPASKRACKRQYVTHVLLLLAFSLTYVSTKDNVEIFLLQAGIDRVTRIVEGKLGKFIKGQIFLFVSHCKG